MENERVAARRTHAEDIPIRLDTASLGIARQHDDHRGRGARRVVGIGHDEHEIGGFEHRGKHLAARDAITAIGAPDAGFQRPLAKQRGRDRLGEIAGDQLSLAYDEIGKALFGFGRDLGAFEQRHDDRRVHIEGERRRRAALP